MKVVKELIVQVAGHAMSETEVDAIKEIVEANTNPYKTAAALCEWFNIHSDITREKILNICKEHYYG